MTADIKLLPLPELASERVFGAKWDDFDMQDYARANVAHATAAKDAEIERLRALLLETCDDGDEADADLLATLERARTAETRAERLAEALRPFANLDLRPDGFDKRPDDQTIYVRDRTAITVGDVRRARAALRDHDQEGKDG